MIRLFCKLKRITFHYFIFTLSLSFRKLPRCFFWYSPMFRTYQPSYFPQQVASLPHPAALFLLCPDLFSPRACLSFITSQRYLTPQLSRFLHKSIPYITRAYARERQRLYRFHTTACIARKPSPYPIRPFASTP